MSTNRSLPMLAQVREASPCPMRWEDMEGDDRTRFCGSCGLHVHNLSALTRTEAEALVARTAGEGERLCGAYYQRADGSILTRDCPVGLGAVRVRVRRRVARVAAALGLVAAGGAAASESSEGSGRLRGLRPFSLLVAWLAPASPPLTPPPPLRGALAVGRIACPPAPQASAGTSGQ